MLAAVASHITIAHSAIYGTKPDNFSPGMIMFFDGNPKKYLIGPGDFTTKKATKHVIRVLKMMVTKNDPRDGIQSVPVKSTINTC